MLLFAMEHVNEGYLDDELEKKVEATEHERMLLKQILKKGRAYEIRRLLRRAKQIQNKKGTDEQLAKNQRKANRIAESVEKLKSFTPDQITEFTLSILGGAKEGSLPLADYIVSQQDVFSGDNALLLSVVQATPVMRVLTKLESGSKGIEVVLKTTLLKSPLKGKAKVKQHLNLKDRKVDQKKKSLRTKESQRRETSSHSSRPSRPKMLSENQNVAFVSRPEENHRLQDDFFLSTSGNKEPRSFSQDSKNSTKWPRSITENITKESKESRCKASNREQKPTASQLHSSFLSSMNLTENSATVIGEDMLPKKNRMGQRARQKLWSLKYGMKARHLDKDTISYQRLPGKKNYLVKEKGQAVPKKKPQIFEFFNSHASYKKLKPNKEHKVNSSRGFSPSRKDSCHSKTVETLTDSHPSWEAKKKQKMSEQIQEFKGTKITFED